MGEGEIVEIRRRLAQNAISLNRRADELNCLRVQIAAWIDSLESAIEHDLTNGSDQDHDNPPRGELLKRIRS